MCGIFGIFLKRPLNDADIELGRSAVRALHHRGPRNAGEWFDREAGVFLGHTRLVIFDPSPASNQPLQKDGACISFNGEIFNYKALRDNLIDRGTAFHTEGDTEVLVSAWQKWGDSSLEKLDGAFAFALWDGHQGHLAVDPLGEKSLYVAENEDGIFVCNELATLVKILRPAANLSGTPLTAFLALGYLPAPHTAYSGVTFLAAATRVVIEQGKIVKNYRYWNRPRAQPGKGTVKPLSEKEIGQLGDSIATALLPRTHADAPLCAFLSSGVDSSLVAAMMRLELGIDLESITVSFPRSDVADESEDARMIAAHLNLNHRIVAMGNSALDYDLDSLLELLAQPADTTAALAFHTMCKAVTRDYDIALTGGGADEITLGFGKNAHFYNKRYLYRLPNGISAALRPFARALSRFDRSFGRLANDMFVPASQRYLAHKNYPVISWLQKFDGFEAWSRRRFFGADKIEHFIGDFEIDHAMPESRNVAVDAGTMRASMSTRSPFLSKQVLEAVASYDPRAFIAFGQKSVLRRLLGRYLPDHLINRPKLGFRVSTRNLLNNFGVLQPSVPGVPPAAIEGVWKRRFEPEGWQILALRLAAADRFTKRSAYP